MDYDAIRDLIRQGKVTEVIGSKARVTFEDRDNVVSAPLSVLQLYTGENKSIHMPSIGDEVLCLFLPTGLEDGYIIGSVYTSGNNPPADNNATQYSDGSSISVKDGVLNINMLTAINLIAPKINLNGAVTGGDGSVMTVNGGINASEDIVSNGVSLQNHTNGGYGVDK